MNRTDAASVSRLPFPGALLSGAVAVRVLFMPCSNTDESGLRVRLPRHRAAEPLRRVSRSCRARGCWLLTLSCPELRLPPEAACPCLASMCFAVKRAGRSWLPTASHASGREPPHRHSDRSSQIERRRIVCPSSVRISTAAMSLRARELAPITVIVRLGSAFQVATCSVAPWRSMTIMA